MVINLATRIKARFEHVFLKDNTLIEINISFLGTNS